MGRVTRWHVLTVSALAVFLSGPGQTYGISVFVDPIMAEMGWSRSLVSTTYSIANLLSALGVFLFARQLDRRGHRVLMPVAVMLFVASLLLASSAQTIWVLLAGFTMLRTFGSGIMTISGRTLVPHWFLQRRGRAFSILGIAGALSLAVVPPAAERMISEWDWRSAWRIEAMIVLVVLLPAVLLWVRDRPPQVLELPERDTATGELGENRPAHALAERSFTLGEARQTTSFWILVLTGAVPGLVGTGMSLNQISIFNERGLSAELAASLFAFESVVLLVSTLSSGWLSDRLPTRWVMAAGHACLAIAMIVLLFTHSYGMAILFSGLRGLSWGLFSVAFDVTWPGYFGRLNLGAIRGVTFASGTIAAALGPLPLSLVHDATGSYDAALVGLLVLPVAAMVAVLFAKPPTLASAVPG